ncbi:hypothetical protein FSP39_016596 [Pinctada imbricata]|uniref:RING-type domain-containing protein n=1 Tax=Pinctada imbricata TaxID=66713 RepID=A0AA89BXL2_PINIB|nr:hypothetical protein FSP39_016596 [Pinctada imbricata]
MAACVAGNPPCYPHLQTPTGFTDGNKNVKYGITESSCDINRHHSPETFMSTSKIQSSDNGHLIASPSDECHFTQTSYPRQSKFLWSSTPNFPSIPCSEGAIGRSIDGDQRESLKGKFCLSTVSTNEGRNKFSIDVTDGAGISSSRTSDETEENSMFPHFKNDNSRLISFKDLSSVHHEKKHKLAWAGFFLTRKLDQANINTIKEEIRTLKERKLCKVCCEEDVSIVFLPCAHLVCCAQCAPAIQKCAVCRKLVKGTVRVSFSY